MFLSYSITFIFKQNLQFTQTTEGIPHKNEFLSRVYLEGSAQARA